MYDVAEYISSPKGFDKYELAKMNFIELHDAPTNHINSETIKQLQDKYFLSFVNHELEMFRPDESAFGYEIVGEDDKKRLFISGEYSTIMKGEPELPGHNYYFSFALKKCDSEKNNEEWDIDMAHFIEMSFLRSLYLDSIDGKPNCFKVTIETESGKREKEMERSKVKCHNWVQEFNPVDSSA